MHVISEVLSTCFLFYKWAMFILVTIKHLFCSRDNKLIAVASGPENPKTKLPVV